TRIVSQGRVGYVLDVSCRQDAFGILETCGLEYSSYRVGHAVEQVNRFPAEFGHLCNRLRREFRGRHVKEDVSARTLQANKLGAHCGISYLVGLLRNNWNLPVKTVLHALQIVFTVIVILIEHTYFAIWMMLDQILCVDSALALVAWLPAH